MSSASSSSLRSLLDTADPRGRLHRFQLEFFPSGSIPEWKTFLVGLSSSGVDKKLILPASSDQGPIRKFLNHFSACQDESDAVHFLPLFLNCVKRRLPDQYNVAFVFCCYIVNVIPSLKGVYVSLFFIYMIFLGLHII